VVAKQGGIGVAAGIGAGALAIVAGMAIGFALGRLTTPPSPARVATPVPTPTSAQRATTAPAAAPTTAPSAASSAVLLASAQCPFTSNGGNCPAYTSPKFTTSGSFVIVWSCQVGEAGAGPGSPFIRIVLYDSNGNQVAAPSEPAPGPRSSGAAPWTSSCPPAPTPSP
jgi:hypothetical protein